MGIADRFARALQRVGATPALPSGERKSTVEPFKAGPLVFECWIVDGQPNDVGLVTSTYVWRSTDQGYSCGRRSLGKLWACCGTKPIGDGFDTLGAAMRACGLHAVKQRT